MPLTPLPLADFFMQVSRRGCIKKTMTSVGETILSNHYMGRGTVQKLTNPSMYGCATRKRAWRW